MPRDPRWQIGLGRDNGFSFWTMILMEGSFSAYSLLLPLYIENLGASKAQIGLYLGLWGLFRLLLLIPSGLLIDRFSPNVVMLGARSLSIVGLIVFAAIPSSAWLPLPLFLLACGNVAIPALSAVIAGAAAGRDRARAFTLVYTVAPALATIAAPTVSGQVAQSVSLRAVMLLAAALSAGSLIVFSRITRQAPTAQPGEQSSYRAALADRRVRTLCLLQLATLLILTLGVTLLANYLRDVHSLTYADIGRLGSVAALGSVALGLLFTRLRPFRQPTIGISVAVTCTALSFGVFLLLETFPGFALGFALRGGYAVAWSLFAAALSAAAPAHLRARAFALSEILGVIGYSGAPLLAGPLFSWHPAAPLVAALLASIPLVATLWWFALRERRAITRSLALSAQLP